MKFKYLKYNGFILILLIIMFSPASCFNNFNKFDLKRKTTKAPAISEDNPLEGLSSLLKQPELSTDKDKNHIYFYSEVDQYSCLDLNRKINDLNKDLQKHAIDFDTEPPNIYLHINSNGGSLFAAFSTIDTIMNSKIPIISIIEGCAASAATIISMVCHKRYCTSNSFMLIHQLSAGSAGKYEEMKDDFLNDTKLMELLYKLYSEHTTMNKKTIKKVLTRDLWWDVDECLKHGLIDEIWTGSNIELNIKRELDSDVSSKIIEKRVTSQKRKNLELESDSEPETNLKPKLKRSKK
jgi:ATP-dependent protease ClpP protease subunit